MIVNMKKVLLVISVLMAALSVSAQVVVRGTVKSQSTELPIEGVSVAVQGQNAAAMSDRDGAFMLSVDKTDRVVLAFSGAGVVPMQQLVELNGLESEVDMGVVLLQIDGRASLDDDMILTISESDLESDGTSQSISGLLSSQGDVFSSQAGYTFSPMRFRIRGLQGQYNDTYINGIPMNDTERGYFSYSSVGGLNDMLRTKETVNSTESATFTFGNIGGSQNINARASAIRKGFKVSQVASNRTYVSRTMATYATGLMENGWAVALSASYRYAKSGYIQGTFYDAWGLSLAVEKRFGQNHALSLTFLGSPTHRGQQGGSTQEAYDLSPKRTFFLTEGNGYGNNYYNPNWGYQNGVMRNAKQVKSFTPVLILSHEWKINESSKLTTSLGYKYQMDGRTALNWYKAADPRPDYYRNLPNYYMTMYEDDGVTVSSANQTAAALREELWRTDESYRQVNWDKMYQTNYIANARGKSGRYMVENRRNDQQVISATSVLNYKFSEAWRLDAGVELQATIANHYKLVDDLLGADYWLDIDQYGERDNPGNPNFMQNDLNNPNRHVGVGDRFGYDYNIYTNNAKLWGQATYQHSFFDVYFGAQAQFSNFWRVGNMLNGRSSSDMDMYSTFNGQIYSLDWVRTVKGSYGYSPTQNFLTYAAKAGINYRITGRHILALNAAYGTNAPLANDAYFSQRIKPNLIPDLSPEMYLSADLTYYLRLPRVNGRFTVYNVNFWDSKELSSFYNDEYNTMVNFATYGFNKRHTGAELGVEVECGAGISVSAIAAVGQYIYTTDQKATVSYENGLEEDVNDITIYSKGFHLDGTPEIASSLGIHYFHPTYWFIDLNVNYFTNSYLDFNPLRRTDMAVGDLRGSTNPEDIELYNAITRQERLDGGVTVDLSIGKSIRIDYKYFLNINLSATNILNNTNMKTGGYEQSRFSASNDYTDRATYLKRFPNKYFYAYGATVYLNVGFRF